MYRFGTPDTDGGNEAPFWGEILSFMEHKRLKRPVASALSIIALVLAGVLPGACHSRLLSARPKIEFTKIPPAAQGGRERVDAIAGRVIGARPGQQIVIYARSGPWRVQPWPGGLLLLRIVAGSLLTHDGVAGFLGSRSIQPIAQSAILAGAGVLLILGLWTPIAGALIAVIELWLLVGATDQLRSTVLLASLGIALALLGPGDRAVDARLFGRKRIDIRGR